MLIYGELSQLVGWGWSQVSLDCGVGAGLFADVLPLDLGIPSHSLYTWSEPLSTSLLSLILHGREATCSSRLAKYFVWQPSLLIVVLYISHCSRFILGS